MLPLSKRDEENSSLQNILVSMEQICMWITIFFFMFTNQCCHYESDLLEIRKQYFGLLLVAGWYKVADKKCLQWPTRYQFEELRQNTLTCQAFYCVREEDNKHVMHLSFWAFFLRLISNQWLLTTSSSTPRSWWLGYLRAKWEELLLRSKLLPRVIKSLNGKKCCLFVRSLLL